MYGNTGKMDLRSIKTERALDIAMLSLLRTRNFRKITVKDISDEALVSRATFYARFSDKYDFLKAWLISQKPENIKQDASYERVETIVNQFVEKNNIVIKNLVYSADEETVGILRDFIMSTLDLKGTEKVSSKYIVLSSFCVGGVLEYALWQIRNRFPNDVRVMNRHLYEVIGRLKNW